MWAVLGQVANTGIKAGAAYSQGSFDAVFRSQPGMMADARTTEAIFDNSGWNVSFGSSRIDSEASKTTSQRGADAAMGGGASALPFGLDQQSLLIMAGVALVLVVLVKKRKGA